MRKSKYAIRNYRAGDFNKLASFVLSRGKRESNGRFRTLQSLTELLNRPGYDPGKDMFIGEISGEFIGYLDMTPERAIRRVVLDGLIHPDHCDMTLTWAFLDRAFKRARKLGANRAHVNILERDLRGRRVLTGLGFQFLRRFMELEAPLAKIPLPKGDEGKLRFRHLERGEESLLAEVQNRCFNGSWGYNPNTAEDIVRRIESTSAGRVILALAGGPVAGYCWIRSFPEERRGQILMLGVVPEYRGRGAGKSILLESLSYFRENGLNTAELTVDCQNTAACALYDSLGFKERVGTLWYEKKL